MQAALKAHEIPVPGEIHRQSVCPRELPQEIDSGPKTVLNLEKALKTAFGGIK